MTTVNFLRMSTQKLGFTFFSEWFELSHSKLWMKDWETEVIEDVLKKLQPIKCLEWGSGGSTIHFTKFLPKGAQWFSVEHNRDWAVKIKRHLFLLRSLRLRGKVKIFYISPNNVPW